MNFAGQRWHVLQLSDALDLEFATALAEFVPVTLWKPDRSFLPLRPGFQERPESPPEAALCIRRFPVLRGFARFPLSSLARTGPALAARLARHAAHPQAAPLVCTTPYFASVAEHWPGPVVYWITDLMAHYDGAQPGSVRELDRRMCDVATLVCPNSHRLAAYLRDSADCRPDKIEVLPNATSARSVLAAPLTHPSELPPNLRDLPRPITGVIGNLSENMDWLFLEKLLALTPWLHWAFIGPTEMPIADPAQRRARTGVMQHPRARFTGAQPYRELYRYARALDVAVLPYCRREPTYSGSSTRFYDHLAASHPILATPGVAELSSKVPLLTLVDTPEQAARQLAELRDVNFDDGLRALRWEASQQNTWRNRALTMRSALAKRLHPIAVPSSSAPVTLTAP
jgi:glycosyltransferase involved in cell wall biosynthesis